MEADFLAWCVSLFLSAFTSSTLLPGSSEVLFVSTLMLYPQHKITLLVVATIGNTLGGILTYYIGFIGGGFLQKYFVKLNAKLEKHQDTLQRRAWLCALFSFLPVIGDVFSFGLGVFKYPLVKASILMFVGKLLRYAVIVLVTLYF
jgi:membrane protein YqaA with SNARE-associated domain